MLNPNGKSRLGHIVAGHVQVAVISPGPPPDAADRGSDLAVTAPELNAGAGVGRLGWFVFKLGETLGVPPHRPWPQINLARDKKES